MSLSKIVVGFAGYLAAIVYVPGVTVFIGCADVGEVQIRVRHKGINLGIASSVNETAAHNRAAIIYALAFTQIRGGQRAHINHPESIDISKCMKNSAVWSRRLK